jgi:hypothetical protein
MADAFALVCDPDARHSSGIVSTLEESGYVVQECPTVQLLGLELQTIDASESSHVLIMVALEFALRCERVISTLARKRRSAGLSRPLVVCTCAAWPVMQRVPELDACTAVVILLDTFDPSDLRQLAERNPLLVQLARADALEN